MIVHVQHWDAFASEPGKGNPAGVVLSSALNDDQMQAVSRAIGFNDTAFVAPSACADLRVRYFAPRREVELCGHATIATFVALHRHKLLPPLRNRFTLETRSGVLPIAVESIDGEISVVMTQTNSRFAPFNGSKELLARALGIDVGDLHATLPIVYGSTGRWTLIVPVRDLSVMQRMRPAPEQFAATLTDMPNASIHPFCMQTIQPHARMHARHFSSPASGTLEDAVTGTASGVLGAYYRRFVDARIPQPVVVEQGYEVGREGTVQVWTQPDDDSDGYAVRIAGGACFVRDIEIEI
jgi:PhzF family phenazine biosynthesis protein